MKQLVWICIGAFIFFGCRTEVDIDLPLNKRSLVVNSLNNPDSVWKVMLSYSRHVLDRKFPGIPPKATVTIHDPITKAIIDELKLASDTLAGFIGKTKPVAEKEYLVRVAAPNYTTAEANCYIPAHVPIDKVVVDSIGFPTQDWKLRVRIFFKDPPARKNFYRLTFRGESYFLTGPDRNNLDTAWYVRPISFEVDDPEIASDGNYRIEQILADTFFNGEHYVISVRIQGQFVFQPGASIEAVLTSMSEPYYKYLTTYNLQQSTQGDPFAQPVQVYNNIQNGFGIFAGYNQSVVELLK
jgi:Domain of unknown function (DUF4249)